MASLSQVKLSNVIGAPFDKYVLEQLYLRAVKNSATEREVEDVLFLANKSAWVRLISSVNIVVPGVNSSPGSDRLNPPLNNFISNLGLEGASYPTSDALAKDWVLEAGTSKYNGQNVNLRFGIGKDGAYGLGGTKELGYRPMPGLTGVNIETAGRLGSLRFATINFKVWNLTQLNVVEALYFRLGYTMLLEWGHTQFFLNPSLKGGVGTDYLQQAKNTYGIEDPFSNNLNTSILQQKIYNKKYQMSGNYDGMVGVVTSFNWSFNQEGGYDCSVKLIGKGSIIETLRINQSYKMPNGALTKAAEVFSQRVEEAAKREKEKAEAAAQQLKDQVEAERIKKLTAAGKPTAVPRNLQELYTFAYKVDGLQESYEDFVIDSKYWWYTAYNLDGISTTPDYFYVSPTKEYNQQWVGLFLQKGNPTGTWKVLHDDPNNSQFTLNNTLLQKFTAKDLTQNYNSGRGPSFRNQIYAVKNVQNVLAKLFEWTAAGGPSGAVKVGAKGYYGPNDPLNTEVLVRTEVNNLKVQFGSTPVERDFYFNIRYVGVADPNAQGFTPTRDQVSIALDQWLSSGAQSTLVSIEAVGTFQKELELKGRANVLITSKVVNPINKTERDDISVLFDFTTNNTSFINDVLPSLSQQAETPQIGQEAGGGDTEGSVNNASNTQTNSPEALESSLHLMLTVIKNAAEIVGLSSDKAVIEVPLFGGDPANGGNLTNTFFDAGIFKEVFSTKRIADPNGVPYNLVRYAQKGFNSYLMTDPLLYNKTPFVRFAKLSKAYLVKYTFSNENTTPGFINSPVYIKLGYLLALLNNLCLIYDSDKPPGTEAGKAAKKEPYVFIDFNPETNFCLTSPQHLSVDPKICLIPFNGTDKDYLKIFPDNTILTQQPFTPSTSDFLSYKIQDFKTNNPYQAKTMNILLNIDYLLNKINSFASSDAEHGVYLKGFLDAIVEDVNKCLGNQNKFRVAYRDDSNTVQIVDDQFVPGGISGDNINVSEPDILDRRVYINTPAEVPGQQYSYFGSPRYGQIPVVGLKSTVRSMTFKTNLSTKLASLIAISAQSVTASVNSTDPTSLSHLNQNFQDRYKPYVDNAPTDPKTKADNTNATVGSTNDSKLADEFNAQVVSMYSFNGSIDLTRVETAKNYYIERVSNTKAGDPVTSAAPFIPADLEITLDGISGIVMGNAFTIPEDRLPNSLKGSDGFTKVGFIVTGLNHTIQENEWLTKIKGQMIKLREFTDYGKTAEYNKTEATVVTPAFSNTDVTLTGAGVEDAVKFIKTLEGLYSSKPGGRPIPVTNATPSTPIYAYLDSGGVATIGYGTTVYRTGQKAGQKVTIQDVETVAQAEADLRAKVAEIADYIADFLKPAVPLTNGQLVALISLGYNAGLGGLEDSPIWAGLKAGVSKQVLASKFLNYRVTVRQGTQIVQGLINRRQQESQIFLS